MLNSEYERHIRARFNTARVNYDPFPHLVIQDVLPPELYAEMKQNCPTKIECLIGSRSAIVYRGASFGLKIPTIGISSVQPLFALRPNNPTSFPLKRYAKLWEKYKPYIDLVDSLTIQLFRPATDIFLKQLYQSGFISKERPPITLGQGVFSHRTREWHIPPHVHSLGQLIQSMIYFPLPGSSPEQGTVLYRLRNEMSVQAAAFTKTFAYHTEEIEPAGMMPYLPNTLASFLNTPLAIHASPSIPGPSRRYTFTAAVISDVVAPAGAVPVKCSFSIDMNHASHEYN